MPPAKRELIGTGRIGTQRASLAVYVSLQNDDCIRHFEMDDDSGWIELKGECAAPGGPAPMCLSADGRTIHAGFRGNRHDDLHIGEGNGGLKRLPPGRSHPANAIFQFRFDERTGRLTPNDPPRAGPGVERQWGPRHTCWHPAQPWLYVVNEQGNNISRYTLDRERGTLRLEETISTLPPEGHPTKTSTADIQIHPSGRFLYAPNRGHDSIASFLVDQESGRLAPTGWTRADAHPRAFMLDPCGKFLVCAGVKTGRLTTYRIEPQDGTLTQQNSIVCGQVPMWVLVSGHANSPLPA